MPPTHPGRSGVGTGRTPPTSRSTPRPSWTEKQLLLTGISNILRATENARAQFGCFGLHEWAMIYRQDDHRHEVALRLDQAKTDAVVDAHQLTCTHFDAFRFFTPEATPLNRRLLSRDQQAASEQPGCLHANMDLYKWAVKLGPLVPGALLLDCFELARDIRELDMRASPYDLEGWGYSPVPIESAEGKAEYVAHQRGFADRAAVLRSELRAILEAVAGQSALRSVQTCSLGKSRAQSAETPDRDPVASAGA